MRSIFWMFLFFFSVECLAYLIGGSYLAAVVLFVQVLVLVILLFKGDLIYTLLSHSYLPRPHLYYGFKNNIKKIAFENQMANPIILISSKIEVKMIALKSFASDGIIIFNEREITADRKSINTEDIIITVNALTKNSIYVKTMVNSTNLMTKTIIKKISLIWPLSWISRSFLLIEQIIKNTVKTEGK